MLDILGRVLCKNCKTPLRLVSKRQINPQIKVIVYACSECGHERELLISTPKMTDDYRKTG